MKSTTIVELMVGTGLLIGAGMAVAFVWMLFYVSEPPVSYSGNHRVIPPVVMPGGIIEIDRTIHVHRKTMLTIYRTAHTIKDGHVYMYDLPNAISNKPPGDYRQLRATQLPDDMIEGDYRLQTHVCWKENLFKEACVDAPDVHFRVSRDASA